MAGAARSGYGVHHVGFSLSAYQGDSVHLGQGTRTHTVPWVCLKSLETTREVLRLLHDLLRAAWHHTHLRGRARNFTAWTTPDVPSSARAMPSSSNAPERPGPTSMTMPSSSAHAHMALGTYGASPGHRCHVSLRSRRLGAGTSSYDSTVPSWVWQVDLYPWRSLMIAPPGGTRDSPHASLQ